MVRGLLIASLVVTAAAIVLWLATGGDAYTKYRVVETVAREVDPDDPLAAAGFYDEDATETTSRDEFRFGLLPTPQGLFDRHVVSVATFAGPMWAVTIAAFIWSRRRASG
ncbi:hypothetical protein GF314_04970 [bacterium]|jgi:hypothetical protein|nr:hypothetical protein [bacterium]